MMSWQEPPAASNRFVPGGIAMSVWEYLRTATMVVTAVAQIACSEVFDKRYRTADVGFSLAHDTVELGQPAKVRFTRLGGNDGKPYWVALVPSDTPFTEPGAGRPVAVGTKRATLATTAAGQHEVRVSKRLEDGTLVVVARRQ